MYDGPYRLYHRNRISGLKNVTPHIDATCALIDRLVSHCQRIQLGQLLAAGQYDRNRAGRRDLLKAVAVVGFDNMCTILGTNT